MKETVYKVQEYGTAAEIISYRNIDFFGIDK